jgi:hypothetical protein
LDENKKLSNAVDSLGDLMDDYSNINEMYEPHMDILKRNDVAEIVDKSNKIVDKNKWDASKIIGASRLMEFAVLADDDVKDKYAAKLSLWKRGLSM